MSLSDLKPCPFCGCDGWIVEDRSAPPLLYRPQCKMCGGGLGGFQYRDNAIDTWNRRAEGVAALQQAGGWQPIETAPRDGTNFIGLGPVPAYGDVEARQTYWSFFGQGSMAKADFDRGEGPSGQWYWSEPIHNWGSGWKPTHWMPLPQQTALVEQGVEKIIAPHEPAACGASAPSPTLSAEEVELPNYWRAVVGDTYKPAVLRNVKHMHPTTVKEVFDRYAGTDVADVIAGLIFKNQIANNRSEFFAEEYAKATATPPPPTDGSEG